MAKTKSNKNVAIEANKVEISTKQTTVKTDAWGNPVPVKPRLGLVDIKKIRKETPPSEDALEKELGILSQNIEAQSRYSKKYCLFQTYLPNVVEVSKRVKAGGYDVLELDDKTILVRW